MIKIIEKKKKGKTQKPYYILKYHYMIGDADGDTSESCQVSVDNPYLERYVTLLNDMKPTKGTWGLCLDMETLGKAFGEDQFTEDDYTFLLRTMFYENLDDEDDDEARAGNYFSNKKDNDYANEFYDGVRSDAEYSFLVFEGCEIKYVDEWGEKHKCEII